MNKGYIIILNVIILSVIMALLIIGVVNPILSHFSSSQSFLESKKAYLLVDSASEEAYFRLKKNYSISATSTITLSSSTATMAVSNTNAGKDIVITTPSNLYQKNLKLSLVLGTGISFHYGIQSGMGGFQLNNSSTVTGNIFSSGTVTGAGNLVSGDIISSGPTGLVDDIHATGTVYSHTINNSHVEKDAYYMVKTGTTVDGTSYPNSADQPSAPLPITDEQIDQWESDASVNTSTLCSGGKYTITSDITIGPLKVPCDLLIKGTGITVTIHGPIWVVGNIDTQNSPTIRIDPSLGNLNVPIIADNPSSRTSSSIITLGQNTVFQGSGATGSFVFMISQNSSSENGGSTVAINVGQSSNALVAYAIHGLINLSQSVSLKEVTAYKIALFNSANVTYDTGLANSLFSAGPGGGFDRIEWSEF